MATPRILIAIVFALSLIRTSAHAQDYDIQLSGEDTFLVRFEPQLALPDNIVFEFARSIPGVYDSMDFGNLVLNLRAYDHQGQILVVNRISDNEWRIRGADRLDHIDYEIDDSYGSEGQKAVPYIAGTAIESDHILINTVAVLGYVDDLRSEPVSLSLSVPEEWRLGTALSRHGDRFVAADFNELAESPIMAGDLDIESANVSGVSIDVFVYSSNKEISARQVMTTVYPALNATAKFLGTNPVDRYVFLMQFLDPESKTRNGIRGIGALEHSTSSSYVLSEDPKILEFLNEWVAHEYFHIVTPLTLHSSKIRPFQYDRYNPDSHLWLYEGVTVWASEVLLLRDRQWSEQDYMDALAKKIELVKSFADERSLVEVSRSIYERAAMDDFEYVDNKGSLAAFCLDLILLSESDNEFGLKDLLLRLTSKYGRNKAFDDEQLFNEIGAIGGATVSAFIGDHIINNKPIDIQHYLALIGYEYDTESKNVVPRTEPGELQMGLRQSWLSN